MNEELRIQQERYNSKYKVMVEGSNEFTDALIENIESYSLEELSLSYNLTNMLVQAGLIPKNGHMPLILKDQLRLTNVLNAKLKTLFSHDEHSAMIWLHRTSQRNEEFPYMSLNINLGDNLNTELPPALFNLSNKIMNTYLNMVGMVHGGLVIHWDGKSLKYPYARNANNTSGAGKFFMEVLNY